MTDCVVFQNKGILDMNFVRIMGASVKESRNPIGFFGTGLKYAIATILRNKGQIIIQTGGEEYVFKSRKIDLRGSEFDQVVMNDEPLGFTTELGKKWEPWMAIRELYSNTLDESGSVFKSFDIGAEVDSEDITTVIVKGDCFCEVWENKAQYFITDEKPIQVTPYVDIYESPTFSSNAVFYKGICVGSTENALHYRYNIKLPIDLTEDRIVKWDWQIREAIEKAIIVSKDSELIEKVLTSSDSNFESNFRFDCTSLESIAMSDEFKGICKKLANDKPHVRNRAAIKFYSKKTNHKEEAKPVELTPLQEKQLAKATDFLKSLGFMDDLDNYPITVLNWLGEGIHGQAAGGEIFLAKQIFNLGTHYIASTILEEYVHCRYKYRDESRELQTWLFDRVITMGEEYVLGEPL